MGWVVRHKIEGLEDNRRKLFYTKKSRNFTKPEKVYNTKHSNTVIVLEECHLNDYIDLLKSFGLNYTVEERDYFNGKSLEDIVMRKRSEIPQTTFNLLKFIADNANEVDDGRLAEFFSLMKSIDEKLMYVIKFIDAFSELKLTKFKGVHV